MNVDAYMDEKYGILDYFLKQKENGRIRHLGFSAHGSCEVMKKFLEAYGSHMEFCQIQLNYIDWTFQKAKEKVELLKEYRLPVWVMESLRGGRLATLPEDAAAKLRGLRPDEGVPAWGFRFLQTLPEVTMVLSGMSNACQMKENIATFETEKSLTEEEMNTLLSVAQGMMDGLLPCTACHYCVNHCPKELDIPRLLELYNEHCFTDGGFFAPIVLKSTPKEKHPSACIGCGSCEKVCPQQIKIPEGMADFQKRLGA